MGEHHRGQAAPQQLWGSAQRVGDGRRGTVVWAKVGTKDTRELEDVPPPSRDSPPTHTIASLGGRGDTVLPGWALEQLFLLQRPSLLGPPPLGMGCWGGRLGEGWRTRGVLGTRWHQDLPCSPTEGFSRARTSADQLSWCRWPPRSWSCRWQCHHWHLPRRMGTAPGRRAASGR